MTLARSLLYVLLCLTGGCAALNRPISPDPSFLIDYHATRGFNSGAPVSAKFTPDGKKILFLRSGPRDVVRALYEYDVASGKERELATAESLLRGAEENLSQREKARRERMRMSARGISSYTPARDFSKILVPLSGRLFVLDREGGGVAELVGEGGYPIDPRFSPDGKKVACVRNGDLYVINLESGEQIRLTTSDDPNITHGLSEFVAQEEMGRMQGYWWSPDSASIVYQRTDVTNVERLHIIDAARPEIPGSDWPYPRPGKANAEVRLGVIPAAGGETHWIDWDREAFPYLATVKWRKSAPLTILIQNREQTHVRLLEADPATGETKPLLDERDAAWINLDQQMPRWLPGGEHFLWTSEREGDWTLELRGRDGSLVRALTAPQLGYRSLVSVKKDGSEAILNASAGVTLNHLYRVELSSRPGEPDPLTSEPGMHGAVFSLDHSRSIRSWRSLEGETSNVVFDASGKKLGELDSLAEEPTLEANVEVTRVAGAEREYDVAIIRPRDFDSGRRYPVVESVYGGPSRGMVSGARGAYRIDQWMADAGFIIVRIDGRGTTGRDRAWSRAIKGNFIDAPLADHVEALRALGARYPELDLDRAGIYGWSFGGYFTAMAVARHPELYRAGVAGAPVTDWLYYDTHYTERYMGLPEANAEGYEKSSVLTYADQLERPLMLIHGTTDDNVYFVHSLLLSDALMREGKPHDFLPLSNFTHMVADPAVASRRTTLTLDYFIEHLGGE